ncbi:ribosomal protein S5 domain 2-type protein, partial [Schizophyllum commune]
TSTTTASVASTSALTTSEAEALKASVFQRLHPRIYYERFLEERVRPDGREFDAWRDVAVNVGSISTADGSSLVRLGDTTIVCGVKAEIAQPDLDSPEDGFIVPNVDLPAICSPKFKPGPPTEEAQVLSDRLNEVLTAHDVLPTSSLIIHPGKAAWVLYIDATCINYDGNAFDATLIAMIAALKSTRLPRANYDEDTGKVTCSRHDRVPLTLTNLPIAMSFGVFNGCRHHHVRPHLFRRAVDGHQCDRHSWTRRGRALRHTGGYGRRRGPRRFMHSKRVEAAILSGRIYL